METFSIEQQLQQSDRDARDLSLWRGRRYRFSDDPRSYALAEVLEERLLTGRKPLPTTLAHIRDDLTRMRRDGTPLAVTPDIAAAEDVNLDAELAHRANFSYIRTPATSTPDQVVVIVGAPRSGTSHLVNLLAHQRLFAYLTTASCWAWPVRTLHRPGWRLFTEFGNATFRVDNKRTRTVPGLVMPGEAEDIYARALPTYDHLGGHRYRLRPAEACDLDLLRRAVSAHLGFFNQRRFLTKSPFHTFRIPQFEALWGPAVRYIHIVRDQQDVADSLRRNRFHYATANTQLSAEEAWSTFVTAVTNNAPAERLLTVTHHDLLHQPDHTIARILAWLGNEGPPLLPSTRRYVPADSSVF